MPEMNEPKAPDRNQNPEAFFAPALALVPKIIQIIATHRTENADSQLRLREAQELIEQELLTENRNDAEIYLGCLLKAYLHVLPIADNPHDSDAQRFTNDLNTFIRGNYHVRGLADVKAEWYQSSPLSTMIKADESPAIIAINNGNRLAMWKICETELNNQWNNPYIAKAIAASTISLDATKSGMRALCDELTKHGCNPYKNASVFEFGGYVNALHEKAPNKFNFPLIALFKEYIDYTPNYIGQSDDRSPLHVSLQNPQAFQSMLYAAERFKQDYIIASNIFCRGAIATDLPKEKRSIEDKKHFKQMVFAKDLMPYLAHMLKDKGKLVISNTAKDGLDFTNKPEWIKKLGLRVAEGNAPLVNLAQEDAGIYVLQRDHTLRPPIPYNSAEHRHVIHPPEGDYASNYLNQKNSDEPRKG